jgi:hypothetical protein
MCDPLGLGTSVCSGEKPLFTEGSIYPHGTCIDTAPCMGLNTPCDAKSGLCVGSSTGGFCAPGCAMDDSGAAPTGCTAAGNTCIYQTPDPAGGARGLGVCFGMCSSDADCKMPGEGCDPYQGYCLKRANIKVPAKPLGATCTQSDAQNGICNCALGTDGLTGFCSKACAIGVIDCPSGYQCDTGLPTVIAAGASGFSNLPKGLGGYCQPICHASSECVSGATCRAIVGSTALSCGY